MEARDVLVQSSGTAATAPSGRARERNLSVRQGEAQGGGESFENGMDASVTGGSAYRPHSTPAGEEPLPKMRPRRKLGLVDMARARGRGADAQAVLTRPRAPINSRRGRDKSAITSKSERKGRRRNITYSDVNSKDGGSNGTSGFSARSSTQTLSLEESWHQLDHFRKVRRSLQDDEETGGGNAGGVHFLNVESTSTGNDNKSSGAVFTNNASSSSPHQKPRPDIMSMVDSFLVGGSSREQRRVQVWRPTLEAQQRVLCNSPVHWLPNPRLPRGRHLTINILSTGRSPTRWPDGYRDV